ncbi:prephenate dehydrogenase/arogenate dehydrogenase family protein [Lacibacterium aquatile]|uniref:Prephenate dehydrogenase/arogenate dehydrogenase family protein n=1 Tax=Lacibacterium aquatile TaxID=1168082 RepID=A0ABW5DPJ9_9PROT
MKARDQIRTVGLFGHGAFGRLIVRHLGPRFDLHIHDPNPAGTPEFGRFCSMQETAACDVVILAAPVERLAQLIADIAPSLRPGALVLDVGSVKTRPAILMRDGLPSNVEIICTHPLFGPQSAAGGLSGLKMALCPVSGRRWRLVARFLGQLGLQVITTTPERHDRDMAMVQGLTHLIAKVLVQMEPLPTGMTTRSFDLLMQAIDMVRHDSLELFLTIERDNPYTKDVRERFFSLAAELNETLSAHDRALTTG